MMRKLLLRATGLLLFFTPLAFAHYYFLRPIQNPTPVTGATTQGPATTTTVWACVNAAGQAISGGPWSTQAAAEGPCGQAVASDGVTRFLEERVTTSRATTQTTSTRRTEVVGSTGLKFSDAHAALILISSPSAPPDTTPDQFTFTDQTDVERSATITSAAVTITGIDTSITCSATGGTIDVGADANFQSSRSVSNNDQIRARHTSSASYSTATNTPVDCNGVSDTFTSTTEAESSAGFTPDSGFTVTPASTFAHTNLMTITRSSGSFEAHADYNTANRTWNGHNHLLALFYTVEDGNITGKGLTYTSNTTANMNSQWSVSTDDSPSGLTRNLRRIYATDERGAMEWFMPSNTGTLYASFKMRVPPNNRSGKHWRIYYSGGGSNNGYLTTGGSDTHGAPYNGINVLSSENGGSTLWSSLSITPNTWGRHEVVVLGGASITAYLNGASAGARSPVQNLSTSNSVDIGHQVDNNGRWTGGGTLANEYRYADIIYNLTQARFEIANSSTWNGRTRSEMQVPVSASTSSWDVAINQGEHASLSGLWLYYVDGSGATRIGQFD